MKNRMQAQPDILVVLNETDLAYRQKCVESDVELSESFLIESRAQRMKCSARDIECMFNYERNRHLADEAIIMRLGSWNVDRPAYIDWESINARAKRQSDDLAEDFAAFRRHRREPLKPEPKQKTKRR